MSVKEFICNLKAIPFYIKTGLWVPHEYVDESVNVSDIFVTEKGFRIADSLTHAPNETYVKNAKVMISRCSCCGHIETSWQRGDVPTFKPY